MDKNWFDQGVKFKCTGCGKCCTGEPGYVWLKEEDIKGIAAHLNLDRATFLRKHTRSTHGRISLNEHPRTYDCEFFRDSKCLIYKARPMQCRTFPFWEENLISKRAFLSVGDRCEGINHKDAPMIYVGQIQNWKTFDPETKAEIERLEKEDPATLHQSFSEPLTFGTAGLRAPMGVGPSRLNKYTIRMTTLALARVIKQGKVIIGYDNRHHSREFALEAASVLSGCGIEAIVTESLRPTPFVSFACRYLKCTAAIMITASHNPAIYNGYKVYWSDGAQVIPPHDEAIMNEAKKIKSPLEAPLSTTHISFTTPSLDRAFLDAIKKPPLKTPPKVIYSPLCGTGITLIPEALKEAGITSLSLVEEQATPDGDFPTLPKPNPEEKEALALGVAQMLKEKADLFLASDPDADRLGCVAMDEGTPFYFTGNQIAALCVDELTRHPLPKNSAFVTTIVSTPLLQAICDKRGYHLEKVLTGFKYIGAKITEWETSGEYTFIFGAEESCGYLYGTHARDKDAVSAATLICRIASQENLVKRLKSLYTEFGLFTEGQRSLEFSPDQDMQETLTRLRSHPPQGTTSVIDYLHDDTGLPPSDVLAYTFEDQSELIIRPSGTEPKIKIYGLARGTEQRLKELLSLDLHI